MAFGMQLHHVNASGAFGMHGPVRRASRNTAKMAIFGGLGCIFSPGDASYCILCATLTTLAPSPLQVWDPASRLCLLGADHRRLSLSARSVAAFQRTEIYDWAMTAGECRPLPS